MTTVLRKFGPGVAMVGAISLSAFLLARLPFFAHLGLSALTLAILVGALLGNLFHSQLVGPQTQPGFQFAQKTLLRAGVALYGLNLTLGQIIQVGPAAIIADLFVVTSTVCVGWWIGYRWLGMDRDTVLLASAGSSICGAAAVVATESVLGSAPHKTSAAVGQVVLFGSLAMLLYPLLYAALDVDRAAFGIYVGSTVHEVAQVVAVGKTIGGATAATAVIVKMIRVMMLAPFLLVIGRFFPAGGATTTRQRPKPPAFALAFIAIALVHPYLGLPESVLSALRMLDVILLATAMAALGLDTTIKKLRLAGREAVLLGAILFVYLVLVGGLANWVIQHVQAGGWR